MKKTLTLFDAKKYALASFVAIDKHRIGIRLREDNIGFVKYEYEISIKALEENIFVDEDFNILSVAYIKKLIKVWEEMISFGEDYPFKNRVPIEYINSNNKFDYIFRTLSKAYRFKMIFNYCRKKLKYGKYK